MCVIPSTPAIMEQVELVEHINATRMAFRLCACVAKSEDGKILRRKESQAFLAPIIPTARIADIHRQSLSPSLSLAH